MAQSSGGTVTESQSSGHDWGGPGEAAAPGLALAR